MLQKPNKKITFGVMPQLSWLALLAKQRNLFRAENLNINFQRFLVGKKASHALQKGWIDMADIIDANVATLSQRHKTNVRLLGYTHAREEGCLLANQAAGIHEPADLNGKRIGVMYGTSSHIFVLDLIKHYDLDQQSIELTDVRVDHIEQALLRGHIDAGSVWQPYTYEIQRAAAQNQQAFIAFENQGFSKHYVCLAVNQHSLKKKGHAVAKVLSVLEASAHYVNEHRDEAQRMLADNLNIPAALVGNAILPNALNVAPLPNEFWEQVQVHRAHLAVSSAHSLESLIDMFSVSN